MQPRIISTLVAAVGALLIVLSQGSWFAGTAAQASDTPEGAALHDLPHLIRIIQGDPLGFGFSDAQEVERIALGAPTPIVNLNYDKVSQYREAMRTDDVFRSVNAWLVPVLLDAEAKGTAVLRNEGGRLQFVGFGGDALFAQQLQDVLLNTQVGGGAESVTIVGIGPLRATFALVERDGTQELVLLQTNADQRQHPHFADLQPGQRYQFRELMPRIAQELAKTQSPAHP